jgi:hypothetical protein
MKVFKQLFKEFWLPMAVAIIWTISNYIDAAGKGFGVIKILNVFGPSFFLVAWMTGQVFRVKKQQGVEGKLTALVDKLDEKTTYLSNLVTGADGFIDVDLIIFGTSCDIMVSSFGNFMQYDVDITIFDLSKRELLRVEGKISKEVSESTKVFYEMGNIKPNLDSKYFEYQLLEKQKNIDLWIEINTRAAKFRKRIVITEAMNKEKIRVEKSLVNLITNEVIDVYGVSTQSSTVTNSSQ